MTENSLNTELRESASADTAKEIRIAVRNCILYKNPEQSLICGENGYSAVFDFDAPWDDYRAKIARFVWYDVRERKLLYAERLFEGNTVGFPAFFNTDLLLVGIYAGDALTTAPAAFPCSDCITDNDPVHGPPEEDIYLQLLEYLKRLVPADDDGYGIGDAVPAAEGAMRCITGTAEFEPIEEE